MNIAIIGGIERLRKNYEGVTGKLGIRARVYNLQVPGLFQNIKGMDGIIIFTGTVAHGMVQPIVRIARQHHIPVARTHSSGISGLKRCLSELIAEGNHLSVYKR